MENRFETNKVIVNDAKTQLEWQALPSSPMRWENDMIYSISLGSEWHLPTTDELLEIVNLFRTTCGASTSTTATSILTTVAR